MTKRLTVFLLAMVMALAIGLGSWSTPAQADVTLNLKATWNPNSEPDIGGYSFYWMYYDATYNPISWNGTGWNTSSNNAAVLPVSPQLLLFSVTLNSSPDQGVIKFALKAHDTNANKSEYSDPPAAYNYNIDITPPARPMGLTITKQ